ncbi:MAG: 2-haloacrylate reductase [Deltaproteobacteria bacterium]|jgi:NADPH:quinone reductase-like Zn-dependent oxidoreductase|nr:2-haloacrylate reductase [Deltaproteobacteria bacterium]
MKQIPKIMHAVLLTGHGGLEKLVYKTDVEVPAPKADEVLIRVKGAGVNNTDINTRIGWYSKSVTADTNKGGAAGLAEAKTDDSSWTGNPLNFPRIQGADVCGEIISVGADVSPSRIGERVLVRTMQENPDAAAKNSCWTLGSECNGGFAQYTAVRSSETFAVNSDWTDTELASIPCAYSTAEGLLHRSQVGQETVLITGASGGVGSAAIQLAKLRGATVIAQCAEEKSEEVKQIGADQIVFRDTDLAVKLGSNAVEVVIDLVGGSNWAPLLDIIKPGGRYATSGAIAGPIVELDLRTLYLKDLTLYGCTCQPKEVFRNLIGYIEGNQIQPLVAKTYPLKEIKQAQLDFLAKKFTGKLVLVPPEKNR